MLDISNNRNEHFGFIASIRRAAAARAAAARSGGKGPLKIGEITYKVSSSHDNGRNRHFTPQINSPQGWSAGANNGSQWINMTFRKQFVRNVLTQGRINGAHGQYVKDFDLYYKNSSNRWVRIGRKRAGTNNGIVKTPVNKLTHEIQLNIKSWSRHITMRAGVEFGKPVGVYGTKSVSRVKHPNMNLFPNGKTLRLKTWRNNYVRMRSNGKHVHQGGAGSEEIFQLKRLPQFGPNAIALYGRFKRYLRAHGNKKTIDQSGVRSNYNSYPNGWSWERFWLEDVGGGKIALRTYHGTYLRANRNGWMDQSSVRPKGQTIPSGWVWEKFTPVFIGVSKKVVPKLSDSTILSGLTMLISGSLKLMQTSPKDKERAKKIYARVYTAAKKTVERRKSLSNEVKAAVNKFKSDALKIINPQNLSKEQQKGANLSNLQNIPTDISEIQLSETDSSVGKTSDLKAPDMNMNPDLKDDTKFELFINGKEINNNSNLWLVILVTLFLIGICNLK